MFRIENPEKYIAGLLVRLSNEKLEDLKKYGESGSISNQKVLLQQFCKRKSH